MGVLERFLGPVGFAAAGPIPPPPARTLPMMPTEIASLDSMQLGPFLIPDTADWWLTRSHAWRVPASAQGIQVIAGTLSVLPLSRWRNRVQLADDTLIGQPDPAVPRCTTMFQTVEDLILYPHAYWIVLDRSLEDGRPAAARYVPADQVTDELDDPARRTLRYADHDYGYRDVIRFDAPTPGLLVTGADALRTAWLLERAAQRYAAEPVPSGYLKNTGAVDLEDTEIDDLLDTWAAARRARATAYLNSSTDYQVSQFSAEQLQLVAAREQSAGEIARLMNLPPRYVNAPVAGGGSLTYSTLETARRDLIDLSLSVYMAPITDRLSMNDITVRGQKVEFSLADFYRSDLASLVTTGAAGVAAGLFSITEWRRIAGLPDAIDEGITPP